MPCKAEFPIDLLMDPETQQATKRPKHGKKRLYPTSDNVSYVRFGPSGSRGIRKFCFKLCKPGYPVRGFRLFALSTDCQSEPRKTNHRVFVDLLAVAEPVVGRFFGGVFDEFLALLLDEFLRFLTHRF